MASASSPDRWKRLEGLFNQALEMEPELRAGFVNSSCGGDTELREELESLLRSAEQNNDFIQAPLQKAAHDFCADRGTAALAEGSLFAHYRILSTLGAGGMGQVYLAEDVRLGRKVALKTLRPGSILGHRGLRRFEQEARAASALNHPNILTIYDIGQSEGAHFIASEYVDGPTLREKLVAGGVNIASTVDIIHQVASGLAAAHSAEIVHRDIKPENLVVRADGLVKIVDFGIAKLGDGPGVDALPSSGTVSLSQTQAGTILGTAKYMSPEQARGLPVDGRTDLFSLGSVMYEMLSGRPPFDGQTNSDVIAEILKTDPPPLEKAAAGVPAALADIVSRAMRKDRDQRYQSAQELITDLGVFKDQPRPVGTPVEPKRVRRRSMFRLPLAAAALVAVLATAYTALRRSPVGRQSARPRSLAILPFQNLRPDAQTDFLGFSLADAVITKLNYISSVTVRPSSSVEAYRNRAIDPEKAGAELKVDTLLTGSYLKDGDDLRINTQLIALKPERILWRDSIDLRYEKLLTVQDRVAQQITSGLELTLSPAEADNIRFDNPISREAYEKYLRGVDLYGSDDFLSAIDLLEQSARMEPRYALTWAHLGKAYTTSASLEYGGRDQYRKAELAYERAMKLNPKLIEPRIYMANLLTDTGHAEESVPLLRGVLQMNPNSAEAHWELGYAYRFGGMLPESIAESERSRQIDPRVKKNSSALNSYLYVGEYDKFLASLPADGPVYIIFYKGFGEYYEGRLAEAVADFDSAFRRDPSSFAAAIGEALADGVRRENAEGLKIVHGIESKIQERGVSDGEMIYKVAQAFAVLGDKPSALRMLRRSIEGGFFCSPYFEDDPLMKTLHGNAEFEQLVARARRRHDQFQAKFFPGL